MACTLTRLDAKDFNTVLNQYVGQLMYSGSGTKVMVPWSGKKSGGSDFHNREVYINTFDWSALTAGTPMQVQSDGGLDADFVGSVCLTDGTVLVGYGSSGVRVKEDTATAVQGGTATFATSADVDGTYGSATRTFAGLITDGVTAWCITQESSGGANSGDLFIFKRTAAGTWAAGIKIHDAAGISTAPVFSTQVHAIAGCRSGIMKDGNTGCIVLDYKSTSAGFDQVACLYTTNAWVTTSLVVVKDYTGTGYGRCPNTVLGTDARVRTVWVDPGSGTLLPQIAYSDDYGAHWTFVGSPAILATAGGSIPAWDETHNVAFFLDATNAMYLGTFDNSDGTNLKHYLFTGGDSVAAWKQAALCTNLSYICTTNSSGDGFIAGGNWFRLFNRTEGGGNYSVDILYVGSGASGGGGGAPPITVEAPTGADLPNEYLRLRLAEQRGWSKHNLGVGCWTLWGEGDYTSERRKRLLLASAAIIDPTIDAPANIPVLWKIDDEASYTREVLMTDASGNLVTRRDPFPFEVVTKDMEMGGVFGTSLLRGFSVRYVRPTATFPIEFYVDDVIAYTETVPPSGAETGDGVPPADIFLPCPTDDNSGSRCHLRIFDESEYDLRIVAIEPMWIDKGIRG